MASTLNKLYVPSFERNVRHISQQTESRFVQWAEQSTEIGSTHSWNRAGAQTMVQKVGAVVATPNNGTPFSRRISVVATYHQGDVVEPEDINQMLVDPTSNVALALGAAARRQKDDLFIAAATGTALDETGNNNAFPAGQIVGDYTTEIDFAAVTAVAAVFFAREIAPEESKFFGVGSQQARKLLHLAQATQSFYVGNMLTLIGKGIVKEWMGFDWLLSNRLLSPLAGQRTCIAGTRRAIGFQTSKDIWAKVAEDPSVSFAHRVYIALTAGAVRAEDEQIVQLRFADTCTVAG